MANVYTGKGLETPSRAVELGPTRLRIAWWDNGCSVNPPGDFVNATGVDRDMLEKAINAALWGAYTQGARDARRRMRNALGLEEVDDGPRVQLQLQGSK